MLTLEQAARGFAAAGSDQRLDVLRTLVRAGPKGLTVGEIRNRTNMPASTLAHHLRFLSDGGLIEQHRLGRSVINQAVFDHVYALANFLVSECCAEAESDTVKTAINKHQRN